MVLPLEGIRVIEWAHYYAGPAACALLGDMGAEVIKIESLDGGDANRVSSKMQLPHDMSYMFEVNNRNKKSIALDLRKQGGREAVYRLVGACDVFVQNFRVGSAENVGVDYPRLRRYNPTLVYCSCSGFGARGREAYAPALDLAALAKSGLMLVGGEDMPPISIPGGIVDMATGMTMAFAISAALHRRERTGQGQEIHTSLLGSAIWLQTNALLSTLLTGRPLARPARARAPNPLYNHYRCRDGRWIVLSHIQPDPYWPTLCRAVGMAQLQHDPRFETLEAREENCQELVSILDGIFVTRTRDEWMQVLRQVGDLICAPVLDHVEVIASEQVIANDYITEFQHPSLGKIKEIVAPIALDYTPVRCRGPAPKWGEHTDEVLCEVAGYGWGEISKLKEQGVIPKLNSGRGSQSRAR